MLRPRIIPCLLVRDKGLVKTVRFDESKYVGDPINAVKIFNEKEVDELMVLDIDATRNGVEPDFRLIQKLAAECRMPLCYGGGIKTVEVAKTIIGLGVEKVALSAAVIESPLLVTEIANEIGGQSVAAVLDVRKRLFGTRYEIFTHNGDVSTGKCPLKFSQVLEKCGVGEIVVNSIDNDGGMQGYDLHLAKKIKDVVDVPITVLGGAGCLEDIGQLISQLGVVGAAAGSLFVFKGVYKAVLINYPSTIEKDNLIQNSCRF